jgi:hypothetical protein
MSAHTLLYELNAAPYETPDPGTGEVIAVTRWGEMIPIRVAGTETNTVLAPTGANQSFTIYCVERTDGARTVTFPEPINMDGDLTYVFDLTGDHATFTSVPIGGGEYAWKCTHSGGGALGDLPDDIEELEERIESIALISSVYNLEEAGMVRAVDAADYSVETAEANQIIFQAALTNLKKYADAAHRTAIHLPAGQWAIPYTGTTFTDASGADVVASLVTPNDCWGATIQGVGRCRIQQIRDPFLSIGSSDTQQGTHSSLVGVGTEPTTPTAMLCLNRAKGVTVRDMSFHGRVLSTEARYEDAIGIAVIKEAAGTIGSGEHEFERLTFDKFGTCISLGIPHTAHSIGENNDVCRFHSMYFEDATSAVTFASQNSLYHQFDHTMYNAVDDCFTIYGGGGLYFDGGFAASHPLTFLKFPRLGANETIGFKQGQFIVKNMMAHGVDGTSYLTTWIDMSAWSDSPVEDKPTCQFVFEDLHVKPDNVNTYPSKFDVFGRCTLDLVRCINLGEECLRLRDYTSAYFPVVTLRECMLACGSTNEIALLHADSLSGEVFDVTGLNNRDYFGAGGGFRKHRDFRWINGTQLPFTQLALTDTDATLEGTIWYDASEDKLKFKTGAGVETITSA